MLRLAGFTPIEEQVFVPIIAVLNPRVLPAVQAAGEVIPSDPY